MDDLVTFAQECLDDREREALYLRGVSDSQIEDYRIGYLDKELPDADYPQGFLDWWEHHQESTDDSFILPMTTTLGQVKGFQLRHVDPAKKGYLDYVPSKEEICLFGLSQAMPHVWKKGRICLVEGAFDLFPLQRHIPETTATLTAGISKALWRVLHRLVEEIVLAYDADKRGRDASWDIARSDKAKFFDVKILKFPRVPIPRRSDGAKTKDPNELWEVWGDDRLGVFLSQHIDLSLQETRYAR